MPLSSCFIDGGGLGDEGDCSGYKGVRGNSRDLKGVASQASEGLFFGGGVHCGGSREATVPNINEHTVADRILRDIGAGGVGGRAAADAAAAA